MPLLKLDDVRLIEPLLGYANYNGEASVQERSASNKAVGFG
jgi:hypothetical protein